MLEETGHLQQELGELHTTGSNYLEPGVFVSSHQQFTTLGPGWGPKAKSQLPNPLKVLLGGGTALQGCMEGAGHSSLGQRLPPCEPQL